MYMFPEIVGEHLGGELTITLLRAIGRGFEVHEIDLPVIIESIQELEQRDSDGATAVRITVQ